MTQQGLRQASARNLSGFATGTNYNEDFLRLFDAQGIPAGTFDERQLRWINARLGSSYTDLREAMHVYATGQGAYNWSAMGALENTANFTQAMPFGAVYTRVGAATGLTSAGLLTSFAVDVPQRTNRGLALEPAATNLLLNSVFSGGTTPTSWTLLNIGGTTTVAASIIDSSVVAVTQSGTAARQFLSQLSTVLAGTITASVMIEVVTGGLQAAQVILPIASTAVIGAIVFPVCPANPNGGNTGVLVPGLLQVQVPITVGGIINTRFGLGVNATATGLISHSLAQIEQLSFATSRIKTTTIVGSRGLPVFTELVPAGRTKALLTFADATTTLATGLTPGAAFDYVTPIIAASKGRFGTSELISRVWQA